jgi:hypothetical protein
MAPSSVHPHACLAASSSTPCSGSQLTQYNARISKLDLARRFPLDKVPLKRCGNAG